MIGVFHATATRELTHIDSVNGVVIPDPLALPQISQVYKFGDDIESTNWMPIHHLDIAGMMALMEEIVIQTGTGSSSVLNGLQEDVLVNYLINRGIRTGHIPYDYYFYLLQRHFTQIRPQAIVAEACVSASLARDYVPLHWLHTHGKPRADGILFIPHTPEDQPERTIAPIIIDVLSLDFDTAMKILDCNTIEQAMAILGGRPDPELAERFLNKIKMMGNPFFCETSVGLTTQDILKVVTLPFLASVSYLNQDRDHGRLTASTVTESGTFNRFLSENIRFVRACLEMGKVYKPTAVLVQDYIKYLETLLNTQRDPNSFLRLDTLKDPQKLFHAKDDEKLIIYASNFKQQFLRGELRNHKTKEAWEAFHLFMIHTLTVLSTQQEIEEIQLYAITLNLFGITKIENFNTASINLIMRLAKQYQLAEKIELLIKEVNRTLASGSFDPHFTETWSLQRFAKAGTQIESVSHGETRGKPKYKTYCLKNPIGKREFLEQSV